MLNVVSTEMFTILALIVNLKWYGCRKWTLSLKLVVILVQCRYAKTAQRIFRYSDTQYTGLTLDKILNNLVYRTLFHVNIYGSYKLLKTVRFFGPPCIFIHSRPERRRKCRRLSVSSSIARSRQVTMVKPASSSGREVGCRSLHRRRGHKSGTSVGTWRTPGRCSPYRTSGHMAAFWAESADPYRWRSLLCCHLASSDDPSDLLLVQHQNLLFSFIHSFIWDHKDHAYQGAQFRYVLPEPWSRLQYDYDEGTTCGYKYDMTAIPCVRVSIVWARMNVLRAF